MDLIPKYINDWLNIIENMSTDNTYKPAWGRSILECIYHNEYVLNDNVVFISFDNIAQKYIKYYWNQLFFFNLKQSTYVNKEPIICQEVRKLIDTYKQIKENCIPIWYDKGLEVLNKENEVLINKAKKKIISTLHENVAWRFKNINKNKLDIYEYDMDKRSLFISFSKENIDVLKKYNIILSELLNYKWAQLLESYNHQPKISSKVKGISNSSLKRNALTKYKDILLSQFKDDKIIDFYTGDEIAFNEVSIDHVIPWSFIYSDDLWNLVVTTRKTNSSKSNSTPSEEVINKLKKRNLELLNIVEGTNKETLQYALDNNLVDKYYYDLRV